MNAHKTTPTLEHLQPAPGTSKKLGFLSFGHWAEIPGSRVNSASDSLHQAIDLAVGAEEIGLDGAFFRVHHSTSSRPPRTRFCRRLPLKPAALSLAPV